MSDASRAHWVCSRRRRCSPRSPSSTSVSSIRATRGSVRGAGREPGAGARARALFGFGHLTLLPGVLAIVHVTRGHAFWLAHGGRSRSPRARSSSSCSRTCSISSASSAGFSLPARAAGSACRSLEWTTPSGSERGRLQCTPRAVSSVGRAPARQAGGHWFEPSTAHEEKALRTGPFLSPPGRRKAYAAARG